MHSVKVLGVRVDAIDKHELEKEIAERIRLNRKDYLANVNINAINIAQGDSRFREILNRSPIIYCDGEGVRVGARLLGIELPPRIVLTYWVWDLCALCEKQGYTIFFLGGKEGSAAAAAENVKKRFPHITIAGVHQGYFRKSGEETTKVIETINAVRPNVLFVCFGMPLQEHWVSENLDRLHANVILFGGSTIEYTAGRKTLAPAWMAEHGMEWVYRLFQEPRRLWRRYLIGNPLFVLKVLLQLLREGRQG